ncbi:PQQ-binding-like beta-propeller repeat protein, partial [Streptomyces sp. NPDC002690]
LTLATGGAVYAEVGAGTPAAARKDGAAPDAAKAFTPWRTVMTGAAGAVPYCFTADGSGAGTSFDGSGAGTNSGAPGGGAADAALYCAESGYGVARLDPADGHVLWSHRDSSASARSLATGGGPVLVDEPGVTLRAYGPEDGEQLWSAGSPSAVGGPWSAGDTPLIVGAGGEVKGIDARTGRVRWNHRFAGHALPAIGFHDPATGLSYLYENTGAGNTTLVTAIDAADGGIRWQRPLDGTLTPVGVSDGSLVLKVTGESSRVDTLVRYDPEGRTATRIAVPYGMADPGIVVDAGTAYLLAPGGALVALDIGASTGSGSAERWRLETGVALMSAPVLGEGDRLYFTAADGRLLAVDTRKGNLLGQTAPRLRNGKLGLASFPHAPVPVGRGVVGTAPDGSVFAVDGSDPAAW